MPARLVSLLLALVIGAACASKSGPDSSASTDAGVHDAGVQPGDAYVAPVDSGVEDAGADASKCPADCAPQDAVGNGDSTCPIGYKWTGTDCTLLRGCKGCSGADCKKLFTYDTCQQQLFRCTPLCL